MRAGGGANALGGEQILDAERDAFERPRIAFAQARIALLRSFQRPLRRGEDVGVERLVRPLDRADMRARKLLGGELLALEGLARLGNGKVCGIGHALLRLDGVAFDEGAIGLARGLLVQRLALIRRLACGS